MYHYHCIISQACFRSKTLKMQLFLLCVCVCVRTSRGRGGGESWSQAFLAETLETWDKIILEPDLQHYSKDSDLLRNMLVHKINSIARKH